MARERSPNRDKAFELYKESNGEIQNREIANILGIPEKTVSAWKSRYKWDAEINAVLQKYIQLLLITPVYFFLKLSLPET